MNGSEAVPNEESPPELDDDAALEAAAEEIEQDISSIAQQRDEYLALAQRLQAEFENYKKQTMRRNTEVIENASSRLAEKLLPVLERFDGLRAAKSIDFLREVQKGEFAPSSATKTSGGAS